MMYLRMCVTSASAIKTTWISALCLVGRLFVAKHVLTLPTLRPMLLIHPPPSSHDPHPAHTQTHLSNERVLAPSTAQVVRVLGEDGRGLGEDGRGLRVVM